MPKKKYKIIFLIISFLSLILIISFNFVNDFNLDKEKSYIIKFIFAAIFFLYYIFYISKYYEDEIKNIILWAGIIFGFLLLLSLKHQNEDLMFLSFFIAILTSIFFAKNRCSDKNIVSIKDKVIDTSVIVDGRIKEICKCNFIEGNMLVPIFVINEIQMLADSSDFLKRIRGRRGLDILNEIQTEFDTKVKIVKDDYDNIKETDYKLIQIAKDKNADIVTNDFNLNKIAQLEGIRVLNINELSNAIKPVALPGEKMTIKIIKEGKENAQGIGYLDDGTMIVVDNAKKYLNSVIEFMVTSSIQTSAGRMIFGKMFKDIK